MFHENRKIHREFRSFTEQVHLRELKSITADKDARINLRTRVKNLEVSFATVPARLKKLESSDGLSKKELRKLKKNVRTWVQKFSSSSPTDSLSLSPSWTPSVLPSQIPSKFSSSSPTDSLSLSSSRKPSVLPSQIPSLPLNPPSDIPSKLPSGGPSTCFIDRTALKEAVDLFTANRMSAIALHGDIGSWCTSLVESFHDLFMQKRLFNENLSCWDLSSATSLENTFWGARKFNGDVSAWDVSLVWNMFSTFTYADSFNRDISGWDVSSTISLDRTFREARKFNGDVSAWDVSLARNIYFTFGYAYDFNNDVSGWDVSSTTTLESTFEKTQVFNGDISVWDVSSVTFLMRTFWYATGFNQCLDWPVGGKEQYYIADMFTGSLGRLGPCDLEKPPSGMPIGDDVFDNDGLTKALELFALNRKKAEELYGQIEEWITSKVMDLSVFQGNPCYEGDDGNDDNTDDDGEGYFDAAPIDDNYGCDDTYRWTNGFYGIENFNENIAKWDVSSVTKFYAAFIDQHEFDQVISEWDVSLSTSFHSTFQSATKFNQDLSSWDVTLGTTLRSMFGGALAFNQCLDWSKSIKQGANTHFMFQETAGGKLC